MMKLYALHIMKDSNGYDSEFVGDGMHTDCACVSQQVSLSQ